MPSITDYKITDTSGKKVADVVGSSLSGTVAQNKATFDKLGELIISTLNDMVDYLEDQGIDNGTGATALSIYPVGSIYLSVNNTNPTSLFGGTWEQIKDKFILAAGDTYTAGTTGGEATHTLTTNEMPAHIHLTTATCASDGAHTHTVSGSTASAGAHTHNMTHYNLDTSPSGITTTEPLRSSKNTGNHADETTKSAGAHTHSISLTSQSAGAHTHTISVTNASAGGGTAFSEMPPYLTVYVWKRTA